MRSSIDVQKWAIYARIRGSRLWDSHEAAAVRPVRSYCTFVPYLLYGAVQGSSCGSPQGPRAGYTPRRAIDPTDFFCGILR
jgi:hypothetical protein